jgi:uncharacterized membrane protein
MANFIYSVFQAFGFTHPFHPVLTHLVIGPIIAAFLFSLVAWIFKKPVLYKTAHQLTWLAVVFWFFTVFFGFMDWLHFYNGELLFPIIMKLIFAGVLLPLLLASVLIKKRLAAESKILIIFYGASLLDVLVIGYFGGALVFG